MKSVVDPYHSYEFCTRSSSPPQSFVYALYYILDGSGIMTVDDERRDIRAGDCIFYPSRAKRGLENTGGTVLRYLSAASPSFTKEQCKKAWPLPSMDEEA